MNDEIAAARKILAETERFLRDEDTRAMQQYLESKSSPPLRNIGEALSDPEVIIRLVVECGLKSQRGRRCKNPVGAVVVTPHGLAWVGAGIWPLEGPRREEGINRHYAEPLAGPMDEPLKGLCAQHGKRFELMRVRAIEAAARSDGNNPVVVATRNLMRA